METRGKSLSKSFNRRHCLLFLSLSDVSAILDDFLDLCHRFCNLSRLVITPYRNAGTIETWKYLLNLHFISFQPLQSLAQRCADSEFRAVQEMGIRRRDSCCYLFLLLSSTHSSIFTPHPHTAAPSHRIQTPHESPRKQSIHHHHYKATRHPSRCPATTVLTATMPTQLC